MLVWLDVCIVLVNKTNISADKTLKHCWFIQEVCVRIVEGRTGNNVSEEVLIIGALVFM